MSDINDFYPLKKDGSWHNGGHISTGSDITSLFPCQLAAYRKLGKMIYCDGKYFEYLPKFRVLKNFAVLSAMFRPLSRSRAPRSKRHTARTSPAHKWRSFQNFTFYWCRKKLENFEFRKNSKLRLINKIINEFFCFFVRKKT